MMNISSFDIKEKFKTVKNVVMQVTPIEAKVRACTSNDPWGAKSTDKAEIAEATYNFEDYKIVMQTIWKRLTDTGKDWRHVYKGLQLLEYLIVHGSERVHEEAKDSLYTIRSLRSFRYVDEKGKDYGEGIRELAKKMVKFIQDEKAIQEEREKAKQLSGKYSGFSRSEARYMGGGTSNKPSRHYGDDYEEDRSSSRRRDEYDDDDDRPSRKPSRRFDEDEEEEKPRPSRRPAFDDDEGDGHKPQRDQPSRGGDFRPRAPSNGRDDSSTNVRKPRPPSPVEEAPVRTAPQRTTQQPVSKPAPKPTANLDNFFTTDPESFFDEPAPVSGGFGGNQGGFSQGGFGGNQGFNPRAGAQQPQGNDFEANFDDNAGFEDDFDNQFVSGNEEKKDNLFDFTEGLVNFSLNDSAKKPETKTTQGGVLQPSNSSGVNTQNLTLSQKAKLQGKKIPTTSNTGRGAPIMQPQPPMGSGVPPMGRGVPPMGNVYGVPPMGGGVPPMGRGVPPMGNVYGVPPMGSGVPPMGNVYGVPPQPFDNSGFGGPQFAPVGRGAPPMGNPGFGQQSQGMGRGSMQLQQNRPPQSGADIFF
jgi:epsin